IQGGGVAPSRGGNFTTEEAYAVLLKFMQYVHQGVWHLPPGGSSSDPEVFQPGHPEIKIGLILAIPNVWYANIPPWDGTTAYTPTIGGNDFGTILSEMI